MPEEIKLTVAIVGAVIALLTLAKGVLELSRQGAQKRAEFFLEMRRRLKSNPEFLNILLLVEHDDHALSELPYAQRRDFLGFYEEVYTLMNTGLIPKKVVHYMFGYYALKCLRSNNFWLGMEKGGLGKHSPYWSLFVCCTEGFERMEGTLEKESGLLRHGKYLSVLISHFLPLLDRQWRWRPFGDFPGMRF